MASSVYWFGHRRASATFGKWCVLVWSSQRQRNLWQVVCIRSVTAGPVHVLCIGLVAAGPVQLITSCMHCFGRRRASTTFCKWCVLVWSPQSQCNLWQVVCISLVAAGPVQLLASGMHWFGRSPVQLVASCVSWFGYRRPSATFGKLCILVWVPQA